MMSESIYKRILEYLKSNPGATPREIADILGVSIGMVRVALLRLRESGYIVKSVKGGYFVKSGVRDLSEAGGPGMGAGAQEPGGRDASLRPPSTRGGGDSSAIRDLLESELSSLKSELTGLRNVINALSERVTKLEEEYNLLMKSLKSEGKVRESEPRLSEGVVMRLDEAKARGMPVDSLVRSGNCLIIGNYLVTQEFLEEFRRRFPINLRDVRSLTREERELLDAMVGEGLAYLHAGREYRLT
ncbi:MAG: winged helix-turn-helix domain-containing protein [Zestosphaera sp.]